MNTWQGRFGRGGEEGKIYNSRGVDTELSVVVCAGILALLTLRCEPVKVRGKVG